jgi:RNA polymerase sigma-70 factor (ECF subfamily)
MTDSLAEENILFSRWREGDRTAGESLMQRYRPLLFGFFRRRTCENVEELVQDTFVACIGAIDNFEGRSHFRSFVFGIAHRQFLMNLRARRAKKAVPAPDYREPTPSQVFASKEEARQVDEALNGTSLACRQVLRMFYWEDLSIDEIARTLEVPIGTVKSRLARARTMLKRRMVSDSDITGELDHVVFKASH